MTHLFPTVNWQRQNGGIYNAKSPLDTFGQNMGQLGDIILEFKVYIIQSVNEIVEEYTLYIAHPSGAHEFDIRF